MQQFYKALVAITVFTLAACASVPEAPKPYPETHSYDDIFTSMDAAREQAMGEDKLLMYVMGANWCHDSVAFMAKTQNQRFADLIDERYLVLPINIGNFDYVREVITRFGEPVIYGTPTVLVVEPRSGDLLNRSTLPYWRNAEAITLDDTLAYFEGFAVGQLPVPVAAESAALATAMAQIDAFENDQAQRIYQAYGELGQLMETQDIHQPSDDFMGKWKSLAAMRGQITQDLSALRQDAVSQDRAGADPIALTFPHYDLFVDSP